MSDHNCIWQDLISIKGAQKAQGLHIWLTIYYSCLLVARRLNIQATQGSDHICTNPSSPAVEKPHKKAL